MSTDQSSSHVTRGAPQRSSVRSLRERIEQAVARTPRSRLALAIGGFLVLLVCLLALGVIADDVREQEAIALDAIATPLLHSYASPMLNSVMQTFTDLGSTPVVLPLLIAAVVLLLWRRHGREALFLTVAMVGSVALNQALKLIFERPRPQLSWAQVIPEYSFPSGHAMNSFVFYVSLALIMWVLRGRRAGLIAVTVGLLLALCIGVSRIYFGYHYFTDVVGGYLAGAAWLLLVSAVLDGGLWLRHWRSEASRP